MAKIPSGKKIPSSKFPQVKRKIASRKIADEASTASSSKLSKAKKATRQAPVTDAPLERPTDEQSRQAALAILKDRTDALRAGKDNAGQ